MRDHRQRFFCEGRDGFVFIDAGLASTGLEVFFIFMFFELFLVIVISIIVIIVGAATGALQGLDVGRHHEELPLLFSSHSSAGRVDLNFMEGVIVHRFTIGQQRSAVGLLGELLHQ